MTDSIGKVFANDRRSLKNMFLLNHLFLSLENYEVAYGES